jgi:hypothetical protein
MNCPICQEAGYLRCECSSAQPYCDQCADDTRCAEELDAQCWIYHKDTSAPTLLTNLGLPNGSNGQTIIEKIDKLLGQVGLPPAVVDTTGRLINVQVFTSSATWTKPTGSTKWLVKTVGGGGGGGGTAQVSSGQMAAGGGGGAGANSVHYLTSGVGSTVAVTVGAGGAGGQLSNSYLGQSGGSSSFGSFSLCSGGTGGGTMASGTSIAISGKGNGGVCTSSGTGFITGGSGEQGTNGIRLSGTVGIQGRAASNIFGGPLTFSAGNAAVSPGTGGYGGIGSESADSNGGSGVNGIIIVYSYS